MLLIDGLKIYLKFGTMATNVVPNFLLLYMDDVLMLLELHLSI